MKSTILKVSLSQAARALRLCYVSNQPVALWGPSGVGKSDVVRQSVPQGWKFYDVRLSDKEATDLGGIPMPNSKTGRVEYMPSSLLPLDTDEKCIVLFDEVDRTSDMSVQNMMLQIVLDRSINGHKLSPNARIVLAGNGVTDVGTMPLSTAACRRMCHLYIESQNEAALGSWLSWAKDSDCTSALQSFAKYRNDVWVNGSAPAEFEELASPSARTWVMADKLYQASLTVKFETADIILPLLAGCIGKAGAIELLAWYKLHAEAPTVEEIAKSPSTAKLPTTLGVFFALGTTLAREAKIAERPESDAFATYISRWPMEQAGFAFTGLLSAKPEVATSAAYRQWQKSRN